MEQAILYRILRPIATPIFKWWFKPTIIGNEYIPLSGAAVIAGNHKHALDPLLVDICTKRTVHALAKKELHDGVFGWLFKAVGTIAVDLDAKKNPESLRSAIQHLQQGKLVNVSPEAARNYSQEILLPFKYGAVVMAKKADCLLIPYAISGDYKFRSDNLRICFRSPLPISDIDVAASNELLFNTVKELLLEQQHK